MMQIDAIIENNVIDLGSREKETQLNKISAHFNANADNRGSTS